MQKLIIVLALVSCSFAAPLEKSKEPSQSVDLTRPSPINPDIPSDPKPEEKITLITDPKVVLPLASNSTKPTKLPGPYVLPRELLLRAKREDKDSSESEENSSEEEKKPSRPLVAPPSASLLEKHATKSSTTPIPSSSTQPASGGATVPASTSSATVPAHPRLPYSPLIHQHNEHLFKPTTEAHSSGTLSTLTSTTTSASVPSQDHVNDKRDIPVPLTRKFQQNEDDETKDEPSSAKVPKEEAKQEEEKDEGHHKAEPVASATATTTTTTKTTADQHPATIARPIPVAELFAKKPSTE